MPERQGQLLRQALQARLAGTGESVTRLYELTGGLAIGAEGIGIQQDSSSTRTRFTASSNWRLTKLDVASTLVTSGVARAVDGININDQEYFAATWKPRPPTAGWPTKSRRRSRSTWPYFSGPTPSWHEARCPTGDGVPA